MIGFTIILLPWGETPTWSIGGAQVSSDNSDSNLVMVTVIVIVIKGIGRLRTPSKTIRVMMVVLGGLLEGKPPWAHLGGKAC